MFENVRLCLCGAGGACGDVPAGTFFCAIALFCACHLVPERLLTLVSCRDNTPTWNRSPLFAHKLVFKQANFSHNLVPIANCFELPSARCNGISNAPTVGNGTRTSDRCSRSNQKSCKRDFVRTADCKSAAVATTMAADMSAATYLNRNLPPQNMND